MEYEGKFVLRVYGLILNTRGEVLITDEFQLGQSMTKFPGGGLQYGEGPIDCLVREIREECNQQEIKNIRHFYTTDFFQKALFYPNHQLVSIYYTAELNGEIQFKISDQPHQYPAGVNGGQSFRWVKINMLDLSEFSFPIDKLVAAKLQESLEC
ncbi:protein containing NUDIX domain [Bacteroidales bacterium 6E]|nr:protein containing NUDIX domain [Bacteroidales bacterium 6E]